MKSIILILVCSFFTFSIYAQSWGVKLAMIDTGKSYSENDLLPKRYNNILEQLTYKYVESKERIADLTVVAKRQLEKVGLSEPMINIMEGILKIKDVKTITKQYADNTAVYITIRQNGRDHAEALADLQSLLYQFSMETIVKTANAMAKSQGL